MTDTRTFRRPADPSPPSPAMRQQPQKLPHFEVLRPITPVNTGNLLAFVSVKIGREPTAITVHKWRLVRQPGQSAFVSPPQETWNDPQSGERRYKTLLEFPKAWRPAITDCVLSAWQEYEAQRGAQEGGTR